MRATKQRNVCIKLIHIDTSRNNGKVGLDTTYHDRRLAKRLQGDAEFRLEFVRQRREIARIDSEVRRDRGLRDGARS